jgi:outer membrane cobalamin receptor
VGTVDRRLGLNAALFRTEVKNEVEQDPVDLKYYQTGRKRVQGVELSVTARSRATGRSAPATRGWTPASKRASCHGERQRTR